MTNYWEIFTLYNLFFFFFFYNLLIQFFQGQKKIFVFLPNCCSSQVVYQAVLFLSTPEVQRRGRTCKGSSPQQWWARRVPYNKSTKRSPKAHGLQSCFQEEHTELSHLGINMCFFSVEPDFSNKLFQWYKLDQSVCLWGSTPSWCILVVLGSRSTRP